MGWHLERWLRGAALVGVLVGMARAQGSDDVLGRAMRDELARSMKDLRLASLERPYFIAYHVSEVETLAASATGGSLLSTNTLRRRMLAVEVRVGDYAFDNSNFMGGGFGIAFGGSGDMEPSWSGNALPLADDYLEIRRKLWLATDAAYKGAVEQLAEKRASLLNKARADSLADFTKEPPTRTVEEDRAVAVSRGRVEALARELSRIPELADMSTSSVDVAAMVTRARYVNSEGTTYVTSRPLVTLSAQASAQATNGAPLTGSVTFFARALDSLPTAAQLASHIRLVALHLDSLRAAPPLERYTGPVLFEGRAAAELFAEAFAPALLARRNIAGAPELEVFLRMTGRLGTESFADKLGGRVMPNFMSVVDDPTVTTHEGAPLMGSYAVDDDGVPGKRKRIVEGGILRSLLSTRTPVEGMPRSTGNRRAGTAAPSNLIVESTGGLSERALRDRLIALVRGRGLPYGVIVRELGEGMPEMDEEPMAVFARLRGGTGSAERSVLRAYRVYPDGREALVRAGSLTGMDAASFKDIVAVSNAPTVHHAEVHPSFDLPMWVGFGFVALSQPVASYVVPSLLFEDVAIAAPRRETPTLPLIPPPARMPR